MRNNLTNSMTMMTIQSHTTPTVMTPVPLRGTLPANSMMLLPPPTLMCVACDLNHDADATTTYSNACHM